VQSRSVDQLGEQLGVHSEVVWLIGLPRLDDGTDPGDLRCGVSDFVIERLHFSTQR